jgi:hypothetical protein
LIVRQHVRFNDSDLTLVYELNQSHFCDSLRKMLDHDEIPDRSPTFGTKIEELRRRAGRAIMESTIPSVFGRRWLGEFWVFSAATEGTFFVGGDLAMAAPKKERGIPRSWLRLVFLRGLGVLVVDRSLDL